LSSPQIGMTLTRHAQHRIRRADLAAALDAASRAVDAQSGRRHQRPVQAALGTPLFRGPILLPGGAPAAQITTDDADRRTASGAITLTFSHQQQSLSQMEDLT
jgi:hypothetical protein